MDSQIPHEILVRRKRRRIIKAIAYTGIVLVLFVVLLTLLRGSLPYSSLNVSTVSRGTLEITVSSMGKVVPLYEEIVTSPISTKVLEVYKKTGDAVKKGDLILKLDLAAASTDYERLRDELEMKRSQMTKQQISTQTQLSEMAMQIRVDSMRMERARVQLRNEYYLDSIGASTADRIRQAELDLQVQVLQYDQLKLKYANLRKNSDVDAQVAELDFNIASKKLDMAVKTMEESQVLAPMDATLTWVNGQIGSNVSQGAQLAILSDLGHFMIEAEIADSYADKVSSGMKATVEIGQTKLVGTVGNIVPSITNGQIKFTVTLEEDDSPVLRSGLEAEVYVANAVKEDVLTVANRTYYRGAGTYDMWVVSGNIARKKTVVLGEGSYEKVEIVEGLTEGETVIVNDMNKYRSKTKLRIKR